MATNNAINTPVITLGDTFTISGAFPTTFTVTGSTSLTLPTSGTLATVGQTFSWNDVSGTTQAAAVGNGYVISNSSLTTITLPFIAPLGSMISVQGKGTAGFRVNPNTGQNIHLGNMNTNTGLVSTNQWDAVTFICVTDNAIWAVYIVIGNLTVL